MSRQGSLAFNPQYCNSFFQGTAQCCYQEIVRGKEYTTELPVNMKLLAKLKKPPQAEIDTEALSPAQSRKSI